MNGGEQKLSLVGNVNSWGCWWNSTIVHEFIHAFGFHHEQTRPDRDDYVEIIWQNIPKNVTHNFQIFEGSRTYGVEYDGYSVMHYSTKAFSNFSFGDGYTIMSKVINLHYFSYSFYHKTKTSLDSTYCKYRVSQCKS